jgi:hypothetical protein
MLVEPFCTVFIGTSARKHWANRSGFADQQFFFMLLAIALHVVVLYQLPYGVSSRGTHLQAISARFESHRPMEMVSLSSMPFSSTMHQSIPAKAKQPSYEVKSRMPSTIAETPSAARHELSAVPPHAASAAPVTGLALPQPGVAQGHRPLWTFSQGGSMPDQQTLFQQQQRRDTQLAMQTARVARREEFETQLRSALEGIPLNSPCRIIIPFVQAIRLHCENEADTHAVDTVIKRSGQAPAAQNDAVLIIDLTPRAEGGSQAISHYADASFLPSIN